jgi:hypothetical protein
MFCSYNRNTFGRSGTTAGTLPSRHSATGGATAPRLIAATNA